MLVLSRKKNEKIRIGSDIVLNIIAISDNQVRVGIEAPADVKILREEVYESIKNFTKEASEQSKEKFESDLSKLKFNKLNKNNSER